MAILFLFFELSGFGQFSNPIVNGVIGTNEYGDHTIGQNRGVNGTSNTDWFCAWNADSIFFAASGGFDPNTSSSSNGDAVCIYLDVDPQVPVNAGAGMIQGTSYDGVTPNLPFSADAFLFVKVGQQHRLLHSSGNWTNLNTSVIHPYINFTTKVVEFKISWTDLGLSGRPSAFNWTGFISYDNRSYTGGSNGSIAHVPSLNPGGTAPDLIRYYTIDTTTNGTSVQPFERESYTHIGNDISNFASIDVWDFTMNTSGKYISRVSGSSGDWNIDNDLVVGSGTIYFNTSSSVTNIDGDLVTLSGGILDIDNSTGVTNIAKSINSGGTLKGSSSTSSVLNLKLNFDNQGTFTSNNTKFIFNGTSIAQTISGDVDGSNAFGRLEIDNPNGLIDNSNDSLSIADTLFLTNGIIQAKKYVVLHNGANVSPLGGSDTSYVDSCIIWGVSGIDSVVFPVGNQGNRGRIGVQPKSTYTGRLYKAVYLKEGHNDNLDLKTQSPQLLYTSFLEHWLLDAYNASSTNDSCKISLYWNSYSDVATATSDRDSLKVCHYNSSSTEWEWIDSINIVYDISSLEGAVKTKSYVGDFSPFSLGTSITANPLPVNLISFTALLDKNREVIDVNWSTASELDCEQFILQKKVDFNWKTMHEQRCHLISNEVHNYTYADNDLLTTNLYQLIQRDVNGKEMIYGPVLVDFDQSEFKVLPNPANTHFSISNADNIRAISLIDAFGKVVALTQSDYIVDISGIRSGVYSLLITDKSGNLTTQRLLIVN